MIKYFYFGIAYLILMASLAFLGYGIYLLHQQGHSWPIILSGVYVVYVISFLVLFVQKRHNQAKISWGLIMILLPILGQIIYLIFGQRYKDRKNIVEYRKKETFKFERLNSNSSEEVILQKQSSISNRGIYDANVEVFGNVNNAYKELFNDIRNAKHTIYLQYYIVKSGEIFEQFKTLIIEKAKQGVKVKLIVDDFGRWGLPWYRIHELEKSGVEIAIFGKVHFPFIGSSNGYRTHRKVAIIDNSIVHTGGINIADEYASLSKNFGLWIDYNTRITGEAVISYILLFIDDWKISAKQEINIEDSLANIKNIKTNSKLVLVEDSPEILSPILQDSLVSLILNAKQTIEIVTPYLVPPVEIFAALRTAAMSGVKVSLYIPGKPDKKTVFIGTRTFAKQLMEFGVKVYECNNILVHSKIGIFDNKYAYFGTANLDMRSFYSQFEIINVVSGQAVKDLALLVKDYKKMTTPLKPEDLKINHIKERMVNVFLSIFSPLM